MKKKSYGGIISIILLVIAAAITMFPFYIMIATATKTNYEFAVNFWGIKIPPEWGNFKTAWDTIYMYIFNSFKTTFFIVAGVVALSVFAGYAFAKMKFRGKEFFYFSLLLFKMVPAALLTIPQFINVYNMGLHNTHAGVILPTIAGSCIMPIILSRGFFESIPDSIFESARIDGATELSVIRHILLPVSRPIISTNALFTFFGAFNAYTWPLIVLSDDKLKTITIGINRLAGQYGVNYGVQMATYCLICIPLMILISLTMKAYVGGITGGAIKA